MDSKDIVRLRAQRIAQGITQQELATIMGVCKKEIQGWESPKSYWNPDDEQLAVMEESFDGFLTGIENCVRSIARTRTAYIWRSQQQYEAAGHSGDHQRMNLKVVISAIILDISGRLAWDDVEWKYAE